MTNSAGICRHDADQAYPGYTLFCETFSGPLWEQGKPATVYLIDMEGQPVHSWTLTQHTVQSHCRLLPDGHLLVPTHDRSDVDSGNVGLFEYDAHGNLVWQYRCRMDHDYQPLDDGNLLIHTITERMCPALGPELKRHPYMVEITRDKQLLWEWRGEDHLEELEALLPVESWRHVMDRATGQFAFDWAHNNTLQLIPPNAAWEQEKAAGVERPRFAPGNIVFSYRSNDVIGVIDRPSGEIVWAWGPGVIDGQHKPHMLPNGHILLFDNGTLRGYSRIIEMDPLTGDIVWEYVADPPRSFFSAFISSVQRLPNGNTLICEGSRARFFEVTPEKETVWEFINPYHSDYGRPFVYRCRRYDAQYVRPLLDAC